MSAWATEADTLMLTGFEVTAAQVAQAQAIVELFSDTTADASDAGAISSKNLRLLKMAVCYQAAWMTVHPDVFTNVDLSTYTQDGLSATQSHENAGILAPLARRCIRRLSWKRPGSIQVAPRLDPALIDSFGPRDSAVTDDRRPWSPL